MSVASSTRTRFLEEYRQIRYSEGRGSDDPAYYRALPFQDLSGRNSAMWRMRARTYQYFEEKILNAHARRMGRTLDVLDLGAGNGWLSNRLAMRKHRSVAVDIFTDARDGLLATRHYENPIAAVQAEFDHLPFPSDSFDLAVFNSSFHYSANYELTLSEARRCLRRSGLVVILDSPIYRQHEHGQRMVEERRQEFLRRYGFRSDTLHSIEFLDEPAIAHLAKSLRIKWQIHRPWYGWAWHMRPVKSWYEGRRPPSRFWILVGRSIDV